MRKLGVLLRLAVLMAIVACAWCRAAERALRPYDTVDSDYRHAPEESYERWKDWKFGLRIHWGTYALYNVEASWHYLKLSGPERMRYAELYKDFNPVCFSAEQWMDLLERSGMKFFTFTTRHHDGFSMFDTQTMVTQRVNYLAPGGPQIEPFGRHYSIMETPFRRDVVKELATAARKRGIGIGLYFSNPDWFDADFRMEWDRYQRDLGLPLGDRDLKKNDPAAYARYIKRHREQVRELLTNYGRIDMLCLDMDTPEEAWPDIKETVKMARRLQPWLLLRDRGIGAYGDYNTPENWIPKGPDDPRLQRPWMLIHTLAGIFAYEADGSKYRSGEWIVSTLVDTVAKGGVFEVGIGPDANGLFHPLAIRNLEYAGRWLKVNGEAIYATRPWKQYAEGDDVRFTASKDRSTVYAIVLRWPGEQLVLKSVRAKPGAPVEMLGVQSPLSWSANAGGGMTIQIRPGLQDPARRPCQQAWVFRIPVDRTN